MATITLSSAGVTRFDALVGRQGNDSYTIAGDSTTTMMVDTDTRWGTPLTPWAGGMGTITPSSTVGGSWVLEGRYVRLIPYNSGTGNVPAPGTTVSQGSASGKLIGVYSALNAAPESVGAAMPTSGFIKINQWNEVPYTASAITVASTSGANLVPANVSGMEGTLAASDFVVTAGAASLTNSSVQFQAGAKSMRIATSSTTTTTVKMANGTRFMIGAGLQVTVSGYIRGSDVKSCTLAIEWFDSTNTSISTTTIQTQNCTTTGFTQYTAAAVTAPANTRWASINVTVTSPTNGGLYYVDELTATHTGWSTGATATAADRVGWIEPVSVEGVNHIITSAGQEYYSDNSICKGSWYEIGTTDGNRATTYQIPTNGGLSYHGGVLVDKAAETSISAASWSAGVATFTSTAHGLTTGDRVFIGGVLPRAYTSDINNIEACTVINANSFSIPMATDPGTYTSGGTVAAVEWYPTTTDLNTTIRTETVPGKVCWLDSATGLLRFGNDGTTSTGGFCPATGLKIRIPNVMTAATASGYATPLTNALNATVTSRCRFYAGTTIGRVVVSQMSGTWNTTVVQTGEYCYLNDCVWVGQISLASQQSPSIITFNCTGGNGSSTATTGITIGTHLAGATIQDCTISVGSVATTKNGVSLSTANNVIATNNKIIGTGDRAASCWGFNLSIGSGATISDTTIVNCGGVMTTSQYTNGTMTDTRYWASGAGYVPVASAQSTYTLANVSPDWVFDGLTFDQPGPFNIMRNAFSSTASTSDRVTFRNIGTYASPINAGSALHTDKAFSRTTTTATITHTAHGLRTNDIIYVTASTDTSTSPVSSARTAITAAAKTITVTDANTFTFTCLNAGATSGTIDYYACGLVGTVATNTSKDVVYQNVHIIGASTSGVSGSINSDDVTFENCTFEYRLNGSSISPIRASNNQVMKSIYWNPYEYSQPASALGSHFVDYFTRPTTTPGADTVVSGATWSRVTTLCTITKANHGLFDNMRIYVENSSNQAAIPTGTKALTVVVVDKNTFTISCTNSGSTSGTLDYRIPGDGYFMLGTAAPSSETSSYVTTTGTAAFTGASSLYMPAVNDQVIWETPYYMLGWDHFAKFPVYAYGSGVTNDHYDFSYSINTGSGWSSYKNLGYKRAGGGGSASSTTVTMTSTTGVAVDDYVYGIGIAGEAQVVSIDSATNITVSVANTGTVSGVLDFNYSPNEATFPSTGFKLRVKAVTNTVNTGAIYNIHVGLVSTETTRAELYDQTTNYTLTLTGLTTGSDIVVLEAGTSTPRVNVDANAGTTYGYVHSDAITGTDVDICIYKTGYVPYIIRGYTLTSEDASIPIAQVVDRNYRNP